MVNLPVDVMLWPACCELDDISHTIWGIIRHWLPASGEKMRKAPILFHYTNLAEGMTEQRLETDVYVPLA
ncbi:putative regulatory protein [Escherichia coli]|uniref:Putative regulatory protein n=1 Tax=Escherichia coli TaxID=562 RepID=A0A377D827_ECOLX|nr:putative regulatory protein [Escherichia coli]